MDNLEAMRQLIADYSPLTGLDRAILVDLHDELAARRAAQADAPPRHVYYGPCPSPNVMSEGEPWHFPVLPRQEHSGVDEVFFDEACAVKHARPWWYGLGYRGKVLEMRRRLGGGLTLAELRDMQDEFKAEFPDVVTAQDDAPPDHPIEVDYDEESSP